MTEKNREHDHYYSTTPRSSRDRRIIEAVCHGQHMRFVTDAGVFSKDRIDAGTLLLIEKMRLPGEGPVLDLGCGYGPIGLTIAKLRPDLKVHLVDPNERAVALAVENAALNNVSNAVSFSGFGFEPLPSELRFTAIYTNPPYRAGKRVVFDLMEQCFERLTPGGFFTCVGQKKQGIQSVRAHLTALFGNVDERGKGGGYRVLESMKGGS